MKKMPKLANLLDCNFAKTYEVKLLNSVYVIHENYALLFFDLEPTGDGK